MNILIAVTNLKRINGGVCTHIVDLCKGLTEDNIVLVADGNDYQDSVDKLSNVTYYDVPFSMMMNSVIDFVKVYRELVKLCKLHHIDIIHLHGQRIIPVAWFIRVMYHIPFLWTNHIDAIPQPKLLSLLLNTMKCPVISVSADLKKQLVRDLGAADSRIRVIYNGIDLMQYDSLTEKEIDQLKAEYSISEEDYVISEVARLTYGKGQDLLVRAVELLKRKYPEIKIKIIYAGTGDLTWFGQSVLSFANDNSIDVKYLGFQSPRNVFGVSDLAALPSYFEGFPLMCIEALAMECPVVRADTPGATDMKDVVLIHPKGDYVALSEKIEYAIFHKEEMRKMAMEGRRMCETVFNTTNMCNETRLFYIDVLKEHGRYEDD